MQKSWLFRRCQRLSLGVLCLVGATLLLAVACGRSNATPLSVDVQQLWRSPRAYEGRLVTTTGTERVFGSGTPAEYFVVESADGQYRVGLLGVPASRLHSLVNQAVRVTGRFHFHQGFGNAIDVTWVTAAHS